MTCFVEVFRPAYPCKGIECRVIRESAFSIDTLSPGVTALFQVPNCNRAKDAVPLVLEWAAGKRVTVTLKIPKRVI